MPLLQVRRKPGQVIKQPAYQMVTRARSQILKKSEAEKPKNMKKSQRPGKKSISKTAAKSSVSTQKKSVGRPRTVPAQKKSVARPRTVPARKKSVARPRTALKVSCTRQPKKESKIKKCGQMKHVKMETQCKNLRLKVADLRKENGFLKKQLSVYEEWRKSNSVLRLENAILKDPVSVDELDFFEMEEAGMDSDEIKAELLKMGFPPLHCIWNKFESFKRKYMNSPTETNDIGTSGTARPEHNDIGTSGTARPEHGKKDKENEGKCSKKIQQKNVLQEEYDRLNEKSNDVNARRKQESASNLCAKKAVTKAIQDKISKLQQREVKDLKVIQELEGMISTKRGKFDELEDKWHDLQRQSELLGIEYSEKKKEHQAFEMNVKNCETCKKLRQERGTVRTDWKGSCAREKTALKERNAAHKQCADGCRQLKMLESELKFLVEQIDCTKQLYFGDEYVAESGRIFLQEALVRLKQDQQEINHAYKCCLTECGVPCDPLTSSSSSSVITSSDE